MRKLFKLVTIIVGWTITSLVFAAGLVLNSTSLIDLDTMPPQYTCDGTNTSPALNWSGAPSKTQVFAMILSDPDAPGGIFYHWILYNIPKSVNSVAENTNVGVVGTNSWKMSAYKGPCPPKGATHHYLFDLYALDSPLNVPAGADAPSIIAAMQNHVLDEAEMKLTFGH